MYRKPGDTGEGNVYRRELADRLAARALIPKHRAMEIINTIFDTITEGLLMDGKVAINGFGVFTARVLGARRIQSFDGLRGIHLPAVIRPFFRPCKAMRTMQVENE